VNTGYLGLGSNLGERRALLQAAVDELGARGVRAIASSSVYETEPVGEITDQPDFLNVCVRVETELDPEGLLDACKAVEREVGRGERVIPQGPRTIDVDVLLLGDRIHRSGRMELPHEDIAARRFVLVPLLELDGELVIPGSGRAAEALERLGPGQRVVRAGPPLAVPGTRGRVTEGS
jgi:2-amino-4-hydroxy-6-hydroxymethyldihydropteridine diphosphokinase